MTPLPVTQKDIARELGVSVSLVSRVLSGKAEEIGVAPATIHRIQESATTLGYVPSAMARGLKGMPTQTVGVVVYDFEDPFFGPLIGQIQHAAHREGYSLLLVGFEGRHVSDADLRPLQKHALDGLIILGSGEDIRWAEPFVARGLPVTRIGGGTSVSGVHDVGVNERQGVELLVQHLVGLGHREIGFVGGTADVHALRRKLFVATMERMSISVRSECIVQSSGPITGAGEAACRTLLEQAGLERLTALVASSDIVALGAMRALMEEGFAVPRDISVVGYDDIPLAALVTPELTTIRQPVRELAERALRATTDTDGEHQSVSLNVELVERESTRKVDLP